MNYLSIDGDASNFPLIKLRNPGGRRWNGVLTWQEPTGTSRYGSGFILKFNRQILNTAPQILHHGLVNFAQVRFYFTEVLQEEMRAFALVSLYSPANDHLLGYSNGTLIVCRYQGEEALVVIDVKCILSVVAMVPLQCVINGLDDYYFVIEKIGLDVVDEYTDAEEDE